MFMLYTHSGYKVGLLRYSKKYKYNVIWPLLSKSSLKLLNV